MADTREPVLTGGCQCGAVRYAVHAEPEGVHFCHCRMCQRAVGGPFAALAPVRRADMAWTRGAPALFASSSVAERGFCRDCGTPLSFAYSDSDWIDLTVGSFDRPDRVPPGLHYGTESRMPWLQLADDWPQSTTDQSLEPHRRETLVSRQG
jgi:hypothetical protein